MTGTTDTNRNDDPQFPPIEPASDAVAANDIPAETSAVAQPTVTSTDLAAPPSRRLLFALGGGAIVTAAIIGATLGARSVLAGGRRGRNDGEMGGRRRDSAPTRELTPAIADADAPATPSQTEGPYFKANSPERSTLIDPATPGTRLLLTGTVLRRNGTPVAKALLDFWQADPNGTYDNRGYTLRGHQFTAADGAYRLETIIPGLYPGRTRHIHVKVQAPGEPTLTTQVYFPDEVGNARDGIFDARLLMTPTTTTPGGPVMATFHFVIAGA